MLCMSYVFFDTTAKNVHAKIYVAWVISVEGILFTFNFIQPG